jgi:hypothetical protein
MGILSLFRKKRRPRSHAERRRLLAENGRITDGRIIDYEITPANEEIVYYVYTLNGVDFESSEILTPEQRSRPLNYAPGAKVGVRYDPRNQGNSMLV